MAEAPDSRQTGPGLAISRAGFLRGSLAVMASMLEPGILAALAGPAAELSPTALSFSTIAEQRPFDLLPNRFSQLGLWFNDQADTARFVLTPMQAESRPAETERTGASLRLRPAAAAPTLFRCGATPVAPYAGVVVTTGPDPWGGVNGAAILAGLVDDGGHYVMARFDAGNDPARGTVSIELDTGGQIMRLASAKTDLSGSPMLACIVNENYVTALVGGVARWIPVTQARIGTRLDLRNPAVLSRYQYGFGAEGAGSTIEIAAIRAGYFGEAGLRDLHVISYADGTPYIEGGKLYLTATQAGLAFFPAAHWGVWTLDLENPSQIEPVAKLFFARDGLVLGDHGGQIVADDRDGGFHVAVSGWGDFAFKGTHIHYARSFADLLQGVHVIESDRWPLPTEQSSWDPAMVRLNDTWMVGFVESPSQDPSRGFDFHPALARGPTPGGPLTLVGADTSRHQTEGVVLQKIGGQWYLLASDGAARRYPVYDLSMRLLGHLEAPYPTNTPHPQIVPVTKDGATSYLLVTFNGRPFDRKVLGYGTHGDVIVMRAAQTMPGYEFPPRSSGPRQ